jgi:hypothetical protein
VLSQHHSPGTISAEVDAVAAQLVAHPDLLGLVN